MNEYEYKIKALATAHWDIMWIIAQNENNQEFLSGQDVDSLWVALRCLKSMLNAIGYRWDGELEQWSDGEGNIIKGGIYEQ